MSLLKTLVSKVTTSNIGALLVILMLFILTMLVLKEAPDHLSEMIVADTSIGTLSGKYLFEGKSN